MLAWGSADNLKGFFVLFVSNFLQLISVILCFCPSGVFRHLRLIVALGLKCGERGSQQSRHNGRQDVHVDEGCLVAQPQYCKPLKGAIQRPSQTRTDKANGPGAPKREPQKCSRNVIGIEGPRYIYSYHIPSVFLGSPFGGSHHSPCN